MLEDPFRGGGEIGKAGADANHQIRLFRQQISRETARFADAADVIRVRRDKRAFPRLRLRKRNTIAFGEVRQRLASA